MSIQLRFACGHLGSLSETATSAPTCPECGDAQIRRVTARAPKFRGACSGPYAQTVALDAIKVALTDKPLKLKAQT